MKYFKRVSVLAAASVFILGVSAAELSGKKSFSTGLSELMGSAGLGPLFAAPSAGLPPTGGPPLTRGEPGDGAPHGGSDLHDGPPGDNPGGTFKPDGQGFGGVDGGPSGFAGLGSGPPLTFASPPAGGSGGNGGFVSPLSLSLPASSNSPVLTVPEPETDLLLMAGGVVVWVVARKRRGPRH